MSEQRFVGEKFDVIPSMFIFFLIFTIVGGLFELGSEPTASSVNQVLIGAAASSVIYGVVLSILGKNLPARWWSEAIVVGVIFYLIWIFMGLISYDPGDGYYVSGILYAVIAAVVAAIIYAIISRSQNKQDA